MGVFQKGKQARFIFVGIGHPALQGQGLRKGRRCRVLIIAQFRRSRIVAGKMVSVVIREKLTP